MQLIRERKQTAIRVLHSTYLQRPPDPKARLEQREQDRKTIAINHVK
jgi:hypothetical protein